MSPNTPGVYAFGSREDYGGGLPSRYDWAYVGRSDALRARIKQHQPQSEVNWGFRRWLIENLNNMEIWVATTSQKNSRVLEKILIAELLPAHNKVLYKGGQENVL